MSNDTISISPPTRAVLLELAARTGQPAADLLAAAVEDLRQRLAATAPVAAIPGVNPADVWEANGQADAGQLTPHDAVFIVGDEQSDDPDAVAAWLAAFDAIPPLRMTADEEAAWLADRIAVRSGVHGETRS
jgi:hypothetical protein